MTLACISCWLFSRHGSRRLSSLLLCWWWAVLTASALAKFVAVHAELEALAIALATARPLASASLPVLKRFLVVSNLKLFLKSKGVSFHDVSLCILNVLLHTRQIMTIGAATLRSTVSPSGEAFTVELETLASRALALEQRWQWLLLVHTPSDLLIIDQIGMFLRVQLVLAYVQEFFDYFLFFQLWHL